MRNDIRYWRKKAGMTLQQVADEMGSSKAYIWTIENKENPQPGIGFAFRLAQTLGVEVEVLFKDQINKDKVESEK